MFLHFSLLPLFLQACLHPEPEQRLSASELMELPYFTGMAAVFGNVAAPPPPAPSD